MDDVVERKVGELTVRIDRLRCIGSEDCVAVAPGLFELDNERICSFREPPAAAERDRVIEACEVCPVEALTVLDENGQQIVP